MLSEDIVVADHATTVTSFLDAETLRQREHRRGQPFLAQVSHLPSETRALNISPTRTCRFLNITIASL